MILRTAVFVILFALTTSRVHAGEFYALGGVMENVHEHHGSYSWQLEYLQGLAEHAAYSVSYLNEGHIPIHHRDGQAIQLWTRTNLLDRRLSLAAGVGPYYYFDTAADRTGATFSNDHGWKAMMSVAATWYTESRWLFQFRSNWVTAGASPDSLSAVAGIGYQLDPPPSPGPLPTPPFQQEKTTGREVTLFLGRTIVNSFASEHSEAACVEYRQGLWRFVDWTVAWLYEGDNRLVRRNGLTTQLWAARAFLDRRLALGIGGGAYFAIDRQEGSEQSGFDETLAGIITITGSYRFHPHWAMRVSWNRIVTNYNRDTDVILGGLGYLF
jgi:hypothetical protein